MKTYDLVIVGGGPGGYTAAIRAAKLGAKVALIEEKEVGGVCLNEGCIPTKSLLASAKLLNDINKKSKSMGIEVGQAKLDYKKVTARKDRVVKRMSRGIQDLFKKNNIQLIKSKAVWQDKDKVKTAGEDINFKKLIWATGSRPRALKNIPFSEKVLSSTTVLQLKQNPATLLIIGAGAIGIELATFFTLAGTKVSIVELEKEVLPGVDHEAAQLVRSALERMGVAFYLGVTANKIVEKEANIDVELSSGEKLSVERVLNAVGREANLSGLENSNIELTDKKTIKVNNKMETSLQNVYAIGDITGISWLAHVAAYQGEVAAENALGIKRDADYRAVPSCVFSLPEIAFVGKNTNDPGKDEYIKKTPLNVLGKMQADGEQEGFIKMLINKSSNEVTGLTIVGPHASDLLNEGILSIHFGLKEKELQKVIRPHPTLGEIYTEALLETHQ